MSTAQTSRSKTTWVVVADEAIARILRWSDSGEALEPVEELTDPDAHASGQDLRRDAHGRRAATGGVTQRHGAGTTTSAGEAEPHQEAQAFARHVARHITQAWDQHRFDGLQIAAAPRFLACCASRSIRRCVTCCKATSTRIGCTSATTRSRNTCVQPG